VSIVSRTGLPSSKDLIPTGSLMVPTQSPYLPITPEQIVDEAVRAANAGAAMVHIHARDPEDGRPTADLGIMGRILTGIRERSNVIIGLTTGGGPGMTPEERIRVVPEFRPEIASFNMGPVILSTKGLVERLADEEYKYPWVGEGLLREDRRSGDAEYLCEP